MGFDAQLKRYFGLVVLALIGIAAYFQASGMGQLVAASVALDPSALPATMPAGVERAPKVKSTNDDHAMSAEAILDRNPFDSVTGPLNGKALDVPTPSSGPPVDKDLADDPVCDNTKVLLIAESDDTNWSFAALAGQDGKSQLRRIGDEFNGQTVYFIGWNRVWLTNGSSRCQTRMGMKEKEKKEAKPSTTPKKGGVVDEIASKIHKRGEGEFDVERSVVEQILENQAELMRSARIVPEKEGDKVVGIRLFGIKPDSLLGTLGLENGDRLQSINGFEMSDPQKALEAYTRLRTADHLTVSVNRHGKPTNIDFNIK